MAKIPKRRRFWIAVSLSIACSILGAAFFLFQPRNADGELGDICQEWSHLRSERNKSRKTVTTAAEIEKVETDFSTLEGLLIERCNAIARRQPHTSESLRALYVLACMAPQAEQGKKALDGLLDEAASVDLDVLTVALSRRLVAPTEDLLAITPILLKRAQEAPDHPAAARLLASVVCQLARSDDSAIVAPAAFAEAADLIATRYADQPEIYNFYESLGSLSGSPTWAGPFEKHLRMILSQNQHRFVRCTASFALASIVQASGESRQPEAEKLYEEFVEKFDGSGDVKPYQYAGVEKQYYERAKQELAELKSRGLGKAAPEIDGVGVDGRPMKLSEYHGKVVLLNFWATWCFPCMKLVPYERKLVNRLQGRPFAIVGVNSDLTSETAQSAIAANDMNWRSFRDKTAPNRVISDDWNVFGYPTLYLIDQTGVIKRRWIGDPPPEVLDNAIDQLVAAAEKNMTLAEIKDLPVAARKGPPSVNALSPSRAGGKNNGTGFIDKAYKSPDGSEAKYVVFIPHAYDGKNAYPVILYLHGAGLRGSDGRAQLNGALAGAIREDETRFQFITVFPQAVNGDWSANSVDGKRALAILEDVGRQYAVDRKRVYLTGVSMGGEGTWSLAAAHPERWAAIVPLCGGGDTTIAEKIKDIPCWCFQGDADKGVVELSWAMIKAIREVGGQPLYHEYPGVGHNCWDLTYARPDLYEWLLQQKLSR